jgi:hypothetical protein
MYVFLYMNWPLFLRKKLFCTREYQKKQVFFWLFHSFVVTFFFERSCPALGNTKKNKYSFGYSTRLL